MQKFSENSRNTGNGAEVINTSQPVCAAESSTGRAPKNGPLNWFSRMIQNCYEYASAAKAKGKGIEVLLDVKTSPTVDVPSKTEELVALVREQVENRMGIRLNKVVVNITHSPHARPQYPQKIV